MENELLEKVYDILNMYTWEFNDEKTRESLCRDFSHLLGMEVVDHNDNKKVYKLGKLEFMVKISENNFVSLMHYVQNYKIYKRGYKLKKILKKYDNK